DYFGLKCCHTRTLDQKNVAQFIYLLNFLVNRAIAKCGSRLLLLKNSYYRRTHSPISASVLIAHGA
ncbi:MAG: hypothetical protein AAGM29_17845, partial [Cyanobacteria bacterium J06588_4]